MCGRRSRRRGRRKLGAMLFAAVAALAVALLRAH
jgi:hypothetical protein